MFSYLRVVKETPLVADRRQLTKLPREFKSEVRRVVDDGWSPCFSRGLSQHRADDGIAAVHVELVKLLAAIDLQVAAGVHKRASSHHIA